MLHIEYLILMLVVVGGACLVAEALNDTTGELTAQFKEEFGVTSILSEIGNITAENEAGNLTVGTIKLV